MHSLKKDIIGLLVQTNSGQELGVVADIEIDADQHTIIGYRVKKSKLLPEFITGELIVRPKQVLTITKKAMIVDDLVLTDGVSSTAPAIGSA